jgi:hypothetical protein
MSAISWHDRHMTGDEARYLLKMIRYRIGERPPARAWAACPCPGRARSRRAPTG